MKPHYEKAFSINLNNNIFKVQIGIICTIEEVAVCSICLPCRMQYLVSASPYKNEKVAAMLRLGCGSVAAIRYVCNNWWRQSS